ncbi:hypothetical protein FDECE_4002 [Fusarium decemcellulare]|nr:hypothetical protein FDECE_4002 [Fusarium decemcellulare]
MEHGVQIYPRAQKCLSLFQDLSNHPDFVDDDWFEDRAADFKWWLHGLKVLKKGRSSLDYRLRDHPDIQKVIGGLLSGLSFTLKSCIRKGEGYPHLLVTFQTQAHFRERQLSVSEGSGSDSPWSELSDTDSHPKHDPVLPHASGSGDSDPKFYIKTYLGLLSKISIAIRRSGTKLRYMKADEHLKRHSDDDEYVELRRHLLFLILIGPYEHGLFMEIQRRAFNNQVSKAVEIVIRSWISDPARATGLQRRLVEANITRRNRINYARHPTKSITISEKPTADDKELTHPSQTLETLITPAIKQTHTATNIEEHLIVQKPHSNRGESIESLTATDLGSQFVLPRLSLLEPEKKTSSIVTKMTQTGARQDYPSCPVSKGSFQCPYCVQVLSEGYIEKSRWRGHIAQDLGPYSCIYEDCPDPHHFYTTKEEWMKHMSNLHSSPCWVCDECIFRDDVEEPVFDNEQDWEEHISTTHKDEFSNSQATLLASLSKRQLTNLARCPLCKRGARLVRPDVDTHTANHLHSWALRALPYDSRAEIDDLSDFMAVRGSEHSSLSLSSLGHLSDQLEDNLRPIEREIERLRDRNSTLSGCFFTSVEDEIHAFLVEVEQWISSTHTAPQNETLLRHLEAINQNLNQISPITPGSVVRHRRHVEHSLRNKIQAALAYTETSGKAPEVVVNEARIRLLSLDGSGVRGLSTLFILKRIMDQLNIERERAGEPRQRPYEVFDLIGGVGTAIMLGRLEMNIDKCIAAYTELMERALTPRLSAGVISTSTTELNPPYFDSDALKQEIKRIIRMGGRSPFELFNNGVDQGCKVFVCSTSEAPSRVMRLRSYQSVESSSFSTAMYDSVTIYDAALATFVTNPFFKPVTIGNVKSSNHFLEMNNPVNEVKAEATEIWCPNTNNLQSLVKCFISIGAGNLESEDVNEPYGPISSALASISAQAQIVAESFMTYWEPAHDKFGRYCRFNVDHSLRGPAITEHIHREEVKDMTYRYLDMQAQRSAIGDCVTNLKLKRNTTEPTDSAVQGTARIPTLDTGSGDFQGTFVG